MFGKVYNIIVFLLFSQAFAQSQLKKTNLTVLPLMGEAGLVATKALENALDQTGRFYVIKQAQLKEQLTKKSPTADVTVLNQGFDLYKKGLLSYQHLNFDESFVHFEGAMVEFKKWFVLPKAIEGYRACKLYKSLGLLAKGQKDTAKQQLSEMFILDPYVSKRVLSDKDHGPDQRIFFNEVKTMFLEKEKSVLTIQSDIESVAVWVDGMNHGLLPLDIQGVSMGDHHVVAKKEGYEVFETWLNVSQSKSHLLVQLTPSSELNPQHFRVTSNEQDLDPKRIAFLDSLGLTLTSDVFVFLSPAQGQVQAQLYDLRTQERSRIVQESTPERLAKALVGQFRPDGYVLKHEQTQVIQPDLQLKNTTEPLAKAKQASVERKKTELRYSNSIFKKSWFWYTLAGSVAVGAGAFLLLKDSGSSNSTFVIEVP